MMHESWNKAGGKLNIEVNALGQPIMPETSILASHLGVLARERSLLPLNYTDWRHVPKHYKKRVWNEIKAQTNADDSMEKWFMQYVGRKWAGWKHEAKQEHYLRYDNDADRIDHKPERVTEQQWRCLVYLWSIPEVQAKSLKNKRIQREQTLLHTTGRTPHYLLQAKEEKEKKGVPNRIDFYIKTHTKKSGQPVNDATDALMDKLRELKPSQEGFNSQSTVEDDVIFTQVMGPEWLGRVCRFGLGATPSLVFGGRDSIRKLTSQYDTHRDNEFSKMKSKLERMVEAFLALGITFDSSDGDISQYDAHHDKEFAKMKLLMERMEEAFITLGFTFGNLERDSKKAIPNGLHPDVSSTHHQASPDNHQVRHDIHQTDWFKLLQSHQCVQLHQEPQIQQETTTWTVFSRAATT